MIMEGKDKYMAERIILEEKANKVVFREGDVIVKEYVPSHPKEGVFNEAHIHACVEDSGLPIPKILSVGPKNGGWALTIEYVEGKTLAQLLTEDPEHAQEYLERLVDIQLEIGSCHVPKLRNTLSKMEEVIKSLAEIDEPTRYELLQRLHGMVRHTKLCHGDLVPSNVIIREDGSWSVIDWAHATSGNAGADAAITYLKFSLEHPELADAYLQTFCDKAGMALSYVQKWMPLVAAAQLARHKEGEKALLEQWISVVEYQ